MTDLKQLRKDIETEANRLGFSHLGIAPVQPVPHYDAFLNWVLDGKHAQMAYLAREDTLAKRGDPTLILEGCQRMICLALPYRPPETNMSEIPVGKGRISAYARTRDYHEIIWDKLSHLESFIQQQVQDPILMKSYVDTGPVLERSYASAAGLGIAGKNTCLLIQGFGSYFFLAEILTDLALPVDTPFTRDLCGTCQRCVDACPTNCILPDHTIDANRCISYLTIENKGRIPDDLKAQMDAWVFGCDVCQMVCPHNAWTPETPIALGDPLLPEFIDLIKLISEDEAYFKKSFGETPLSRTKWPGMLRNAAVALGNQAEKEILPALQQILSEIPDPGVQDACRWAIDQINRSG